MGIARDVEQALDTLLDSYVSNKSAAICHALVPLAVTGVTIQLILTAFSIIRGESNESFQTLLWKFFRIALITGIALVSGEYQASVVQGAEGLLGALLESMSGFQSVGEIVDDVATPFATLGAELLSQATTGFWPNFGLLIAAGTVSIAEFLVVAIGLGFYLLAKVAFVLVLAVGPAFLLCAMWQSTEKYTESWIGQLLNFILLKVLVASCILLLTDIASKYAAHIHDNSETINVIRSTMALLMCCGSLAIVMLNLPQLATALSGGASISGIGRTIGRAALDLLNKSQRNGKENPDKPKDTAPRWNNGLNQSPPPRTPLYRRNTIEHLRKKS